MNEISKAAAAMGRVKTEKKAAASRANGKLGGRPAYTKCALFRAEADDDDGKNIWWLGTLSNNGTLPCVGGFPTAAAARKEASNRGWKSVRKPEYDVE